MTPQKVKGFVDGLTGLWEENNNDYNRKILLCKWIVKMKIVSQDATIFWPKLVISNSNRAYFIKMLGRGGSNPWPDTLPSILESGFCLAKH